MKCSVPGCDTDEHIVSYTSVFFVNFPEDPVVQNQWITLFGITDAKLIHGLLAGEHKVCSCHFAEDCFGRHPVYGYRYLLPGAVPAVIPQQQMAEFLPESFRLPEDDEDNYYFIYESEAPTPDPQVPLGEVKSEPDFEATSEPNYQSGEEEGLEEIGIKYLDGKYYFFQLNADPADEAAVTPDPTDEAMGEPDPVTAGQAPDDVVSLPEGGEYHGVDAAEKHLDESTCDTAENAALEEELHNVADICRPDGELLRVDSLKVELSEEEFLESVDDEKEMKLVDDYADTERLDDDDGEEDVKVEKVSEVLLTGATIVDPNQTECDEDNFDTEYIDDAESESLEHGSIEALDEVSAFNGKAPGRSRIVKTQGHVCSECGKSFAYPSGLAKHVLTHTKAKPYSCELCDRSFSQKINLKVHMRRHTGERPIPRFSCEVCGKKCQRRSELRVHVAIHEKQYPIACPACESRFAHVTTLYTHLRLDHSDREITMEQVVEKFAESSDPKIIDDKQYVSEGETVGPDGRWECSVCQQRFTYVKMLRRHKRKLHPKIFCCKYCQRTFPYRSMLEKHMTVHTLEKRFGCEHCSAMFSQRSNLNKHVQIKHSHVIRLVEPVDEEAELVEESVDGKAAPYHCLRCNKSFYRQATWLAHLDTHQTDNGHVQPECEVCNMTFASRMSLKTHTRRMHRTLERFLPSFSAKQLPLGGFDALQEYEERAGKEDAGQVEDFFSED